MGKQVTLLQVFAASPGDVSQEREALDFVIRELNQTHSDKTGIRLDLIRWETHAVPGMGTDPQAVINEELGENFDIFIGILSTHFGTATPRAGSGTEEEFERAYARFLQHPEQLRIMFYFKDPVIKASEIDLDQYALVKAFQKKLGEKALYFKFSSTEEFTSLVRIHLSRQVQDWADGKWGTQNTKQVSAEVVLAKEQDISLVSPAEVEAEPGLFDLVEIANEEITNCTLSLFRMAEAMLDLGEKMSGNVPKLQEALTSSDNTKAKLIANHVAQVMEEFSQRMDAELPIFLRSYLSGVDALSRHAMLWESDFNPDDKSTIQVNHDEIASLADTISGIRETISKLQQKIYTLPRMTAPLNKAKTHAYQVLENFNRELSSARNLTEETQKELKRILERD